MAIPGQGPNLGNGPFIWAVQTGLGVLGNVLGGGPNTSPGPGQRAALVNAGYTSTVTGQGKMRQEVWTDPQGTVVPRKQVRSTARQLIRFGVNTAPPGLPPGVLPISPGRPPPRAGTQTPPKYRPPPVTNPPVPYEPPEIPRTPLPPLIRTPGINPNASGGPGVGPIVPFFDLGALIDRLWQYNNVLSGVFDVATGAPPKDIEPGRGDPFPARPRQVKMPAGFYDNIYVHTARMDTGTMGRYSIGELERIRDAKPPPAPAPAPGTPAWMKYLQFGLPLLLPLFTGKQASQRQRQVVNVPDPFDPGVDPRLEPQPSVIFGDIGGRAEGGVGSFTCECLPPKKKRRKKKRTVCYTGTYTERADGTRKLKKRKVACK